MKRFGPGWGHMIAQPMFDVEVDGDGGRPGDGGKDAAFYQAEAQKAFKARDEAKKRLRELEDGGLIVNAEQKAKFAELEKAAQQAEEDRAKRAGEFDALKKNMLDKHAKEIAERDTAVSTLSQRFQSTVVRAEFGTASELFGGHADAQTVLDVEMAIAVLGRYVSVADDDKDPRGYRIVVKDVHGDEIEDAKGNPLPFAQALKELIGGLPNKDRILRGSGKAGSGARGGADGRRADDVDYRNLTPAQMRDPDIIAEAKRRTAEAGGIVMGTAFERRAGKS